MIKYSNSQLQGLVHEMGHNLGMKHDFDKEFQKCSKTDPEQCVTKYGCEIIRNGSIVSCNKCENYIYDKTKKDRDDDTTNCRNSTGHNDDCCTGFMDYGHVRPSNWSECSVRDFEQYYVIREWHQCMNKGNESIFYLT